MTEPKTPEETPEESAQATPETEHRDELPADAETSTDANGEDDDEPEASADSVDEPEESVEEDETVSAVEVAVEAAVESDGEQEDSVEGESESESDEDHAAELEDSAEPGDEDDAPEAVADDEDDAAEAVADTDGDAETDLAAASDEGEEAEEDDESESDSDLAAEAAEADDEPESALEAASDDELEDSAEIDSDDEPEAVVEAVDESDDDELEDSLEDDDEPGDLDATFALVPALDADLDLDSESESDSDSDSDLHSDSDTGHDADLDSDEDADADDDVDHDSDPDLTLTLLTDREPVFAGTRATGTIRWIEPSGLDRLDSVDLIESLAGRTLTAVEEEWAAAFAEHAEGVPRALVQAAAVLRARDADAAADAIATATATADSDADTTADDDADTSATATATADDDTTADADTSATATATATATAAATTPTAPLAELPAPSDPHNITAAVIEASEASDASVRQLLRILDSLRGRGEESTGGAAIADVHLAALLGGEASASDAAASARLLVDAGLVERETDAYGVVRSRIADGVLIGDAVAAWIPAVAQELAAWASHVGPLEASGEAEAALAALRGAIALERLPAARGLARAMAPALAATLRWDQWAAVLEAGRDAAVRAGAHADAGYFHHELAIRALCLGDADAAAVELAAAVQSYDEAGDQRRGGIARRAATVAGIVLPDAVLAVPDQKVLARRYKGAVVGGSAAAAPKKVTLGTASAMVLFGAAAVGVMFGTFGGGGGSGGSGGGGGSGVPSQAADNQALDANPPWYNPLTIPGAQSPIVAVSHPVTTAAGAGQGATQGPAGRPSSVSHSFVQPSSTGPAGRSTSAGSLPTIPVLPSFTTAAPTSSNVVGPPPVSSTTTIPVVPPPSTTTTIPVPTTTVPTTTIPVPTTTVPTTTIPVPTTTVPTSAPSSGPSTGL